MQYTLFRTGMDNMPLYNEYTISEPRREDVGVENTFAPTVPRLLCLTQAASIQFHVSVRELIPPLEALL